MRKSILVLATIGLALLLASGVAWAATVQGTGDPDTLIGTDQGDRIVRGQIEALLGDPGGHGQQLPQRYRGLLRSHGRCVAW